MMHFSLRAILQRSAGWRHAAIWSASLIVSANTLAQDHPTQTAPPVQTGLVAPAFLPDASAPFLDFSNSWPKRAFRAKQDSIQGFVIPWDVSVSKLLPEFTFNSARPLTEEDARDAALLDPAGKFTPILEGNHALIFRLGAPEETKRKGFGRGPARAAGPDASLVFRFISGVERPASTSKTPREIESKDEAKAKPGLLLQRTWFAYYDPIPAAPPAADSKPASTPTPKPTAVILIMPGLYGTPEPVFDSMTKSMREAGFGVLRMLSQPSRFAERVNLELDPADMQASATRVAAILGDRAGECALAAQAAWKYLEEQKPELANLPKGIIGTSGGGMTLPTVFAREPDRYKAAILIGAAADYWLIARRSAYKRDASSIDVQIKGMDHVPEEGDPAFDWKHFDELYLAACPLDSFHCAKAMQGKNVLIMQGQTDLAVPASLGDTLWDRLGKPERWLYPTGHEGLIIELVPRDMPKMIAWLKDHGLSS